MTLRPCGVFILRLADAGADRGDHRLDFRVLERLVEARLLHVDQLAANRKNRLETPVASLLGGAAGGIALDDVKLGQVRIALRAIRQFPGKPPPVRAPLRIVSRALRAASRARAAVSTLSKIRFAIGGF